MVLQDLKNNQVHPYILPEAFCSLLVKGQGKHRNLVIGRSSCGKTFLFLPFSKLFNVFSNHDEYALLEVPEAEIIFLNDFRCSKETVA